MISLSKKAIPLVLLAFLFAGLLSGFAASIKTYDQLVSALKERRDRFSNQSRATEAQESSKRLGTLGRMPDTKTEDGVRQGGFQQEVSRFPAKA